MRLSIMIGLLSGLALALMGCNDTAPEEVAGDRLSVVTTVFPLYEFAGIVGGREITVRTLVGAGAEVHSFDPTPSDIEALATADLVIANGLGLEPWLWESLDALGDQGPRLVVEAYDLGAEAEREAGHDHGHDHGNDPAVDSGDQTGQRDTDEHELHTTDEHGQGNGAVEEDGHDNDPHEEDDHTSHTDGDHDHETDPHVWLDPELAKVQVRRIKDAFKEAWPEGADGYEARAAVLLKSLNDLLQDFQRGLSDCRHDHFVVTHSAYGYLASRFGLEQISITGLTADSDPSPRDLAEVVGQVNALGLEHVLVEPSLSSRLAETLASESGLTLLPIHQIGSVTDEEIEDHGGYVELMYDNLASLRLALDCTGPSV